MEMDLDTERETEAVPWSAAGPLDEPLLRVFGRLENVDLVNAGQVCSRWRALAKRESLWRRRSVCSRALRGPRLHQALEGPRPQDFHRVIRFAPRLADLYLYGLAHLVSPNITLLQSPCKVERLVIGVDEAPPSFPADWVTQLVLRHAQHLHSLHLRTVTPATLQVIMSGALPELRRLSLCGTFRDEECNDGTEGDEAGTAGSSSSGLNADSAAVHGEKTLLQCGKAVDGETGTGARIHGLEWLMVESFPCRVIVAILRAHRHTLRELMMLGGTQRCQDRTILEIVKEADLQVIQKLTIVQHHAESTSTGRAGNAECAGEMALITSALPRGATARCTSCMYNEVRRNLSSWPRIQ